MALANNQSDMVPFNLIPGDKFRLPGLPRSHPNISVHDELTSEHTKSDLFNVPALCSAISHGCSIEDLQNYVQSYCKDKRQFAEIMQRSAPILYFAIARNLPDMVGLLLTYGISPHGPSDYKQWVPPLAFAVIQGHLHLTDTTEVVKILLGAGAKPKAIPVDMWVEYLKQPIEIWPPVVDKKRKKYDWCSQTVRSHIAQGLNLSQRYYLHRANLLEPFTERDVQLAELFQVTDLLKLPYRIVGQTPVLRMLQHRVLNHYGSNADSSKSLVMVFAGPPGHGKTELAEQLGGLLRIKHENISCAQMMNDTELFGSKQGYERSSEGSRLNNHLSRYDGEYSVVVLDEFDKTATRVRNSLLTIMSERKYVDRRTNELVDCSKTMWILTSNLGQDNITRFYESELRKKQDEEKAAVNLELLDQELRDAFESHWGDAFESRIDAILPFFPFSPGEQAVVAHKFLLQNAAKVRKNIDLRQEVRRHMGHCIITHQNDGEVCAHMAKRGYKRGSGARGLARQATEVEMKVRKVYNSIESRVTENDNRGSFVMIEVILTSPNNDRHEFIVCRKKPE